MIAVGVQLMLMVSAIVVVAVRLPEVPVTVTVDVPAVAVLLAFKVSTLDAVVGLVPNEAVTPLGKPVAARVTLPANPFKGATVTVSVPLLPCVTDNVDADGLYTKARKYKTVRYPYSGLLGVRTQYRLPKSTMHNSPPLKQLIISIQMFRIG